MSISRARRSVSLPFPSSPHWVPTTTVAGTRHLRSLDRITHNCSVPGPGPRKTGPNRPDAPDPGLRPAAPAPHRPLPASLDPAARPSLQDDLVVDQFHRHGGALEI